MKTQLTIRELATHLKVPVRTLELMIAQGKALLFTALGGRDVGIRRSFRNGLLSALAK
ncbi:MAG: hypothetical protein HT580_16990 [Dechloromonas sp.]|nr:MAG: hypothetical protein HT580_16990 [Dechloromonas sp.]